MDPAAWSVVAREIGAATARPFVIDECRVASGGCINAAWIVRGRSRDYFIKTNAAARLPMFEAEAAGLRELASANALRVPTPVAAGIAGDAAWLALERIELRSRDAAADTRLGSALAALHRRTAAQFGWDRDNTIGSTPQLNPRMNDWIAFWRDARLRPQLERAGRNGHRRLETRGEQLLEQLAAFFDGYSPLASLLHGDLWSGNAAADARGEPVIYDPAVYYGDREADIAMTELFGGFSPTFYRAYRDAWPLDAGYDTRRDLYNLYHVLNHANLFGGSYPTQAERLIDNLLAAVR